MIAGLIELKKILEEDINEFKNKNFQKRYIIVSVVSLIMFFTLTIWSFYDALPIIHCPGTYVLVFISYWFLIIGAYINRKYDQTTVMFNQFNLLSISQRKKFIKLCSKINKEEVCASIDSIFQNRKITLKYIWIGLTVIMIPMICFFAKKIFDDYFILNANDVFFLVWFIGLMSVLIIMIPFCFNEPLSKEAKYMQLFKNILLQVK